MLSVVVVVALITSIVVEAPPSLASPEPALSPNAI
jgi:hypothetical protein